MLGSIFFKFFFAIFIPLRSYAGGIHLDRYWQCFLCSSGVLCVVLLLAKYVELNSASMLITSLIAIVLIQIGPSGNKNRTLDYEEKVFFSARLQKASFGIPILTFVLWWFELNKYLLILLCTLWLVAVAMILSKITICNQQCDWCIIDQLDEHIDFGGSLLCLRGGPLLLASILKQLIATMQYAYFS